MCDLCNLVTEGRNPLKNIDFGSFFYEPECQDPACAMPMLILKEHRDTITEDEREELKYVIGMHFKGLMPRDIGMRSIKSHWHEHLVLM